MKTMLAILLSTCFVVATQAGPQTFDFKDPKGVNTAKFSLDAPLEAINGYASGISGTVTFDPDKPGATKGKIVVDATSLHVPNKMMNEHLHGGMWMDTAKHKEITFESKSFKNVKTAGDKITAEVTGTMTIKGVAKEITAPVTLTYLKDKLGARVNKPDLKGDLLVIRANVTIKRKDFNIQAGKNEEKVSDTIDLTLSIAGSSPK
jgi:polyisoprenoid-binding protein YceI